MQTIQTEATEIFSVDPVLQQYLTTLLSRKGQIVTIETERKMKTRKGQPEIIKHSEFQCRAGVNYDNIQAVKDGRADGSKPAENAGLPWGEWVAFPYIIEHKGEFYFRCTTVNNGFRCSPRYTIGGVEITKEEAEARCVASEFRDGDASEVFNIRVSSIRSVR